MGSHEGALPSGSWGSTWQTLCCFCVRGTLVAQGRPAALAAREPGSAGVGAGLLENGEDLLEHDPQLKHRHFFWELDHPEIGKYYAPRPSFVLSKSPCELQSAPLLGEHTEYALKEIIGMSDDEITELAMEGVFD